MTTEAADKAQFWDKARAELDRAVAQWTRVNDRWNVIRAELSEAQEELDRVLTEWGRARAEWDKVELARRPRHGGS